MKLVTKSQLKINKLKQRTITTSSKDATKVSKESTRL